MAYIPPGEQSIQTGASAARAIVGMNIQCGSATLVAGVATVGTTIVLTSNSKVITSCNTPSDTTGGTRYITKDADITTGAAGTAQFIIRAITGATAAVTTDTSLVNWFVVG